MTRLLQTIAAAPSAKPFFTAAGDVIAAGRIRATATNIAEQLPAGERIYLYTGSASLFVAGLLAAARKNLTVCLPAHLEPRYLQEIGADAGVLLTDQNLNSATAIRMELAQDGEADAGEVISVDLDLVFYTSGVTGTPKAVHKKIASLEAEAATLEDIWPRGAQHVFSTVSHQHIYGMLFRVFWPVLSGGVSADRPADYWGQFAGKFSPHSTLVSGPAHLTRLPPPAVLSGVMPGRIFSSGALLPFSAASAVREQLGCLPTEVLGSTETGGIAWREQDCEDALWTPFSGVRVDTNEESQISVRSPFAESEEPILTGDIAERVGGKFRLKGRGDRIVKIDGKRVSLARVEAELLAQSIVEAAAVIDLPARKGALGAIVQLNADGNAALTEKGMFRLSREMRRALAGRLEPSERPKHWRFCAIPLDRHGKRLQSALRAVFDPAPHKTLGRGTVMRVAPDSAEIRIEFTPDMIWFEGHFPEQPVLPGIAQVHMATLWAERVWNWKSTFGNLSQLKFRRVMQPGDIALLHLVRFPERQRLKFAYRLNDVVASEGIVEEAE